MTCDRAAAAAQLLAAAGCALTLAAPVLADSQFSASATLESQYRLRGVALTNDEPDVRLAFSYDHASGAYLGAALIGGKTVEDEFHGLGFIAYLGYAQQSANGVTWDFGASISEINLYLRPIAYSPTYYREGMGRAAGYVESQPVAAPDIFHYRADYSEVYGGLSWHETSARLYVSPDYLGQSLRTLYLDLTQSVRPAAHLRLFAHAGVLTPLDGSGAPGSSREHYDLGAGAACEFLHAEIQLAWADVSPQVEYPAGYPQKRSVIIASVTGFF
jgi:hypothetical protein